MAYKTKWVEAIISTEEITRKKLYRAIGRAPKFQYIIQCTDKGNKAFIPMKYFKKVNLLKKIKVWLNLKVQYLKSIMVRAKR